MHKVVDRKWDEMIGDMHNTLEKPWQISNGQFIRADFEAWVTQVTEVRYSRYVDIKMVVEAAQHILTKFQPLVFKIQDIWKEHGDSQSTIDKIIREVRDDIPKLESKQSRTIAPHSQFVAQGQAPWGKGGKSKGGKGTKDGKGKNKGESEWIMIDGYKTKSTNSKGKGKGGYKTTTKILLVLHSNRRVPIWR